MRKILRENSLLIMLVFFVLLSDVLVAQKQQGYSKEFFVQSNDTLKYRMLLPQDFDENKQYPLVLFLHGAGERGNGNKKQLVHGSLLFLDNIEQFPAIVVFPQCPKSDYWSNVTVDRSKKGLEKFKYFKKGQPTQSMKLVMGLMDDFLNKPYVNKNQVYVGGLSMGGMGTFDILKRRPNMFAAAFPICGGGNPKSVKNYADKVTFWIFHGGKDNVVHPYFSLRMVTALQEEGNNVKLTYLENDNHNSWDSAFAEPKLLSWLFSNIKTNGK